MSQADLRYLLRYVFIALTTYSAIVLLRLAFREFQWALRHSLRPSRGYFLLTNPRRKLRDPHRGVWGSKGASSDAAGSGGDAEALADRGGPSLTFLGRRAKRRGKDDDPGEGRDGDYFEAFSSSSSDSSDSAYAPDPSSLREDLEAQEHQNESWWARHEDEDLSATMDYAPLYYHEEGAEQESVGAEVLLGDEGSVMAIPLYPTTLLGRSKTADVRLKTTEVAKRHCTIYRYDGRWYIFPNQANNLVLINGARVRESTELRNRDQLQIGDLLFIFVDERTEAREQGIVYEGAAIDDRYFLEALKLTTRQPHDVFLALNLFMILGAGLILWGLPEAFMPWWKIFAGIFGISLLLIDFYYLFLPKILGYADRIAILVTGFLSAFGLILQARLAFFGNPYFVNQMATGDPEAQAAVTQLMFRRFFVHGATVVFGFGILWLLAFLASRTSFVEKLVKLCFIGTPLLLLMSKLFGLEQYGASLQIRIGPVSFQPTEYVKLSYLIVLANFFKNRPPLKQQLLFAFWAGINFLLILSLPDLGSIMVLLPTTVIVFATMTSDYFKTTLVVAASAALGYVGYLFFPHVQQRLAGWSSLFTEVNDANYQIVYGLQAVARGGLTGRGLGNGNPWGIPLFNSDMIYSILFEEFGLIVGLCVLIFYIVFWFRSARITAFSRDGFAAALSLSLGTALFMEAAVVIAGTMGLIPLTGATLPFIALGNNSLIAKFILVGIFIGFSGRREEGANR